MQRKIFIMAKKMESGGTEVALLNLLNELIKYQDVSITLGLLKKEGIYLKNIPEQVKIIEVLDKKQYLYLDKLTVKNITYQTLKFKLICKLLRKKNIDKYEAILQNVQQQGEVYDIAIDFHGYGYIGTGYVVEKIKSNKKIIFIHDEKIDWLNSVETYINQYDKIFCVSEACERRVREIYPKYRDKLELFRNIMDSKKIIELSKENIEEMKENCPKLLTVGRLEYQKGYDLLLDVAKLLKDAAIEFKWYIIGTGSLYENISKEIRVRELSNNVILLGMKENPYPYFLKCDIYVQPSRHEGYGIAIAEARILEKPIIVTNLDCVREQIKDSENGLLCEFDKIDFYNKIKLLINDENLKNKLIENLKRANKEWDNDIKKLLEV